MMQALQVEVKDSAYDPDATEQKILVRKGTDGRTLFRVFLFLAGPDLPFVESVTYILHPTFPDPSRTVPRTPSNPNCKLEIWTWGGFDVNAVIVDKSGFSFRLTHTLQYDLQVQKSASFVAT